jgi:hypothetical protein
MLIVVVTTATNRVKRSKADKNGDGADVDDHEDGETCVLLETTTMVTIRAGWCVAC